MEYMVCYMKNSTENSRDVNGKDICRSPKLLVLWNIPVNSFRYMFERKRVYI